MRTVSLFRHAKSSWSNPRLDDFDRPLAARGKASAPPMGAYMARSGITPDLVLCSSALRARETLELALEKMRTKPKTQCDDRLYHASATMMLDILRHLSPDTRHVMLLGHNPGLHALALDLFGSGEPGAVAAICQKFPTAALAVITFDIDDWARLAVGEGYLRLFVTPKMLLAEAGAGA